MRAEGTMGLFSKSSRDIERSLEDHYTMLAQATMGFSEREARDHARGRA